MMEKAEELEDLIERLKDVNSLQFLPGVWEHLLKCLREYQEARGGEVYVYPRRINNMLDLGPFGEGDRYFLLKGKPVFSVE